MAFDPLSGNHTVRVPARRNATRIVALRHASRAAARPTARSRAPRILGAILVGVGLATILAVGLAVVMVTTTVGVLSVGLPDPSQLEALTFSEPSVVYDHTGTIELGRFQREERRVVAFGDVPDLVLDATTSAEDRTFWSNSGFDAAAILSAAAEGASGARERGASTITQQLVRARLLPSEVTQAGAAVPSARVVLLVNGKSAGFTARANASGNYSVVLKKTGKKTTSTFQARTTVAERDITATGCASPTPGVPGGCVSATASPFTAVSAKIRIRL